MLSSEIAMSSSAYSARGRSSTYLTQGYLDFTLKKILSRFCLGFFFFGWLVGIFLWIFFQTISLKAFTIPTHETKSVKWRMILQIRFTSKPNGKAMCPLHLVGGNKSQTNQSPKPYLVLSLWLSDEELHLCVSCQLSQTSPSPSPVSSPSKPPLRISDCDHIY